MENELTFRETMLLDDIRDVVQVNPAFSERQRREFDKLLKKLGAFGHSEAEDGK